MSALLYLSTCFGEIPTLPFAAQILLNVQQEAPQTITLVLITESVRAHLVFSCADGIPSVIVIDASVVLLPGVCTQIWSFSYNLPMSLS